MARPHKQTVDYFPHDTDASDGKTLTIIQSKYGNDGYAFWFKLLQLLGKTSGHYYDFNNPADWEFLLAKTHQNDTEKVKSILGTLALLDAIDAELYAQGVIWCQKFVDGVSDAYNRTVDGVPQRPSFLVNVVNKEVSVLQSTQSADKNPKNTTEIPQTKLKETKLKETIEEKRINLEEFIEEIRPEYTDLNFDNELKKFHLYWSEGNRKLQRPKLALRNWMDKARDFKKGGQGGTHRGYFRENESGERKQTHGSNRAKGKTRTTDEQRQASLNRT